MRPSTQSVTHTSWSAPDEAYEAALSAFATGALAEAAFIADVERFLVPVVSAAQVSSIAQTLLKLTVPGVPDIYQGTDLWDHSLVDPDNRRPVDFERRLRLLVHRIDIEEPREPRMRLVTVPGPLGNLPQRPERDDVLLVHGQHAPECLARFVVVLFVEETAAQDDEAAHVVGTIGQMASEQRERFFQPPLFAVPLGQLSEVPRRVILIPALQLLKLGFVGHLVVQLSDLRGALSIGNSGPAG